MKVTGLNYPSQHTHLTVCVDGLSQEKYQLLACPNLPSIALRIFSSSLACCFVSLLTFLGGLPKGGPLILIPLSLQ